MLNLLPLDPHGIFYFFNYLVIKFLSGWFAGGTPADPPPLHEAFFRVRLPICIKCLTYKTFILFYLHLQPQAITGIGGSMATEPRTRHRTATTLFEAPSQIKGEWAPPINWAQNVEIKRWGKLAKVGFCATVSHEGPKSKFFMRYSLNRTLNIPG